MVSTFDEWQSSKMKKRSAWEEHQVNTGLDPEVTSRYAQKKTISLGLTHAYASRGYARWQMMSYGEYTS